MSKLLLPVTEKRELKKPAYHMEVDGERTIPWYVPLMFGSYGSKEWLEILRLLKENGADINAIREVEGETVLNLFLRHFPSFTDIRGDMEDLQRAGYKDWLGPDSLQNEYESLIADARKSFAKVLEQLDTLLAMGADPRILCGSDKNTALHVLIEKIDLSFLEGATEQVLARLVDHGADVNTTDKDGRTPLHIAAKTGDVTAAAYLIQRGARVEARTKKGFTPLHLAAAGHPKTTKLLIEAHADVNALDEKGLTPLAFSRLACIENDKTSAHPSSERGEPYREAQRELIAAGGK